MTKGKKKCEILKTIRCQVAKKNGIPYTYTECTYQGECRGTCPKCEEELRYLTRELEKLKKSGKQVAVAGVAAAVIATSATGCSSEFLAELGIGEHEQQIAGAIPMPTSPVENVTMGDPLPQLPEIVTVANTLRRGEEVSMAFACREEFQTKWGEWLAESGEDYDLFQYMELWIKVIYEEGDCMESVELWEEPVLGGEPLPILPSIDDVIADLQQSEELYMGSFERTTIQVEWEAYLTESGEDYDVFTVDGVQIIVTYDEAGWGNSAALYAGTTTEDVQ